MPQRTARQDTDHPIWAVTELDPEFLSARVPYGHMFDPFLPRLAKMGVPEDVSMRFLVDTPRRIFEFTSP